MRRSRRKEGFRPSMRNGVSVDFYPSASPLASPRALRHLGAFSRSQGSRADRHARLRNIMTRAGLETEEAGGFGRLRYTARGGRPANENYISIILVFMRLNYASRLRRLHHDDDVSLSARGVNRNPNAIRFRLGGRGNLGIFS
jgi:hypothetical protein